MKIKRNDFPIFSPQLSPTSKINKLNHLESLLEQSTNYRPYSSSIHAQKGEEKKGEVVNWQKEAKKRKKHARFSRWDAGTRWRPRPRERVRFFSRKNGFSMSVNSVAETAQSRLTRAPRPLENTTRRDGR